MDGKLKEKQAPPKLLLVWYLLTREKLGPFDYEMMEGDKK